MNYKFRRQHSMGRFVLDFFCAELMLCIEVDGVTHLYPTVQQKDKTRQRWIEDNGVRVIRFTDPEVLADPDGVLERLRRVVLSSPNPSSIPPLPRATRLPSLTKEGM